ncbi:MAG TPA: hypothetical protein PLY87_25820 [Planctomycetaceae bacterium]|nr:hypothetical protein [Planctomycetaceae bacterium]
MLKRNNRSDDELYELLRGAKDGDKDAFNELWIHEEPEIRRFSRWKARGPVVNDELSLGLSNQVAVVVWRKLPIFQGTSIQEFRRWAKAILEKIVKNIGGRQKRYADLPIEIADDTLTASRKYRDQEDRQRLISMLTENEQIIVKYRFVDCLTPEEITRKFVESGINLNVTAVRKRLSRVTHRLAEIIRREQSIGD